MAAFEADETKRVADVTFVTAADVEAGSCVRHGSESAGSVRPDEGAAVEAEDGAGVAGVDGVDEQREV